MSSEPSDLKRELGLLADEVATSVHSLEERPIEPERDLLLFRGHLLHPENSKIDGIWRENQRTARCASKPERHQITHRKL